MNPESIDALKLAFGNQDFSNLYMVIGALIVANVGTIGTIFFWAAKGLWWISKLDSQVKQNKKDVNAAHSRLRDINEAISKTT